MRQFVDYFVLYLIGAILLGFGFGFIFLHPEDPHLPSLVVYGVMAAGACTLAGGHVLLLRREHGGKAPFWLVAISHAFVLFALTLIDIVFVFVLRIYFPHLLNGWLVQAFYGLLGGLAGALAMAGAAFVVGMRKRVMRRHVWVSPVKAAKDLMRKRP